MAMTNTWPISEAKNKFSEVVRRAQSEGPQYITVRGRRAVVVLSARDYEQDGPRRLTQHLDESILDWLKRSGVWAAGIDVVLDLERNPNDVGRDIDFSI